MATTHPLPPEGSLTSFSSVLALLPEGALVAIDGRCGSGKTALAQFLAKQRPCNVLHMDDYYLPLSERTPGWEQTPGGNLDFSRLLKEALEPARQGRSLTVRPYSCRTGTYAAAVTLPPQLLTVVEGSYACHPALGAYDLCIFLTCDPETQRRRLEQREGAHFDAFSRRWIPLEEAYFSSFQVAQHCAVLLDTSKLF